MFKNIIIKLNKENILDNRFLYLNIHSCEYTRYKYSCVAWTAMPWVNEKDILNYMISYPVDLKEQEEIVRRLDAIESEIEKQKKWRDKMSNVKKGLLNHYFG